MKDIFFEALMKAADLTPDPASFSRRVTFRQDMKGLDKKILPTSKANTGAFNDRYNRLATLAAGGRSRRTINDATGRSRKWTIKTPFPK